MTLYTVKWHGPSWAVSGTIVFKTVIDTSKIWSTWGEEAQWTGHVRWEVGPSRLHTNSRTSWEPNRRGGNNSRWMRKPGGIWIGGVGKTSSLEVSTLNKRLWYFFSINEALISSLSTARRERFFKPAAQTEPLQSKSNNLYPRRGPLAVVNDFMFAEEEKSSGWGKRPNANESAAHFNRWMGFRPKKAIKEYRGDGMGSRVAVDLVRIYFKAAYVNGCAKHGTKAMIELIYGTEND